MAERDIEALIERLLAMREGTFINPDGPEAASTIQLLQAEADDHAASVVRWRERAGELEAENEALREGLRPFATVLADYEDNGVWSELGDEYRLVGRISRRRGEAVDPPCITIGDLRRARAALAGEGER